MRQEDSVYKIGGRALPVPDAEVTVNYADLDGPAAGRDQSGFMHRSVLRRRVRTWGFRYAVLTQAEKDWLEELLNGGDTFDFACETGVTRAYCSKQELRIADRTHGIYRDMRFNIIEC